MGRRPLGVSVSSGTAVTGEAALAWTDQHDDVVASFSGASVVVTGSRAYGPFGVVTPSIGVVMGLLGFGRGERNRIRGEVIMGANPFFHGGDDPYLMMDLTDHRGFHLPRVFRAAVQVVRHTAVRAWHRGDRTGRQSSPGRAGGRPCPGSAGRS
jgi:hypothetical protein